MWDNKKKAITFSFDDGVIQDIRLIKLLDKYNLKATFNLNSELFGKNDTIIKFDDLGHFVKHVRINKDEVKDLYKNHEVAAHTLTHPNLITLTKEEIIHQVEDDRKNLEKITSQDIKGLAYPCGHPNFNDDVARIIKENTKIKFARTIVSTYNFDLQNDLYKFNPTVYFLEYDKMFELGEKFIKLKTDEPKLFYIWGHAYELE